MEFEQGKLFDDNGEPYHTNTQPEADSQPAAPSVAAQEVVKKLVLCDPPELGWRYE